MMAKTETTDGKNPEPSSSARTSSAAQEAEIQEMQKLLAAL